MEATPHPTDVLSSLGAKRPQIIFVLMRVSKKAGTLQPPHHAGYVVRSWISDNNSYKDLGFDCTATKEAKFQSQ